MKNLIFLTMLVFCYSCVGCSRKTTQEQKQVSTSEIMPVSKNTPIWVFEDETVQQIVEIIKRDDTVLQFNYTIYDKIKKLSYEINGIAKHDSEMDIYGVEIDEDEDGAYQVREYTYDDKCLLVFRIDVEEDRRMIVSSSKDTNYYNSKGILMKTK